MAGPRFFETAVTAQTDVHQKERQQQLGPHTQGASHGSAQAVVWVPLSAPAGSCEGGSCSGHLHMIWRGGLPCGTMIYILFSSAVH